MTVYSVTTYYLAPIYVRHDYEAETPDQAIQLADNHIAESGTYADMCNFWESDKVDVESGGVTMHEVRLPGEGRILASHIPQEIAPAGATELLRSIDRHIVSFSEEHGVADSDLDSEAVWAFLKLIRDSINEVLNA